MATYTLVAVLLAGAGMIVFAALLQRGITASLDTTLESRTAPVVLALAAPGPASTPAISAVPPGPAVPAAPGTPAIVVGNVEAFSALYRPDGTVADLEPAQLRSSPLSTSAVRSAWAGVRRGTLRVGNAHLRFVLVPVPRADGIWIVAAGANLDTATDASNEAIHQLEVAVPFLILLAAFSAWLLSGAALRPVEAMRADAENLGERDPASRLTVPDTGDELAKLASTFNALLDRLQRSLARQRNLIADAGHELRTPLAVLRTELELADGPGRTRDDLVDSVTHARGEVERLSALADNLLFLARADSAAPIVEPDRLDLAAAVVAAARGNRARAELLSIDLEVTGSGPVIARADASALRRALDNLVANALAATPPGGTVRLEARQDLDKVFISVTDTGRGFPEAFLPHAFERFRRPDSARTSNGGGAGLGLAIVAEIANAHHGAVTAVNNPEGGATVTLALGRADGLGREVELSREGEVDGAGQSPW